MSLTPIDRIIGREVGQLCWDLLPDAFPGIAVDEEDERFRAVWGSEEPDELLAVRAQDPVVEYPVLYLGCDVRSGVAPSPFLYPPHVGEPLRLSEYLSVLRRFLILQFTTRENRHVEIIWNAVRSLASEVSQDELLSFVDGLWRGRWIVGAADWSHMRRSVLAGGTDEGIAELQQDTARLESEAVSLVQVERKHKKSASSMNEWLHEMYCLLPQIFTWALSIAWANHTLRSDELSKYCRVLDEFIADIGTTISIPCMAMMGGESLADCYAIKPLMETSTIDEAILAIRGIYRGRTIIPRVWYERAKDALSRITDTNFERHPFFVPEIHGRTIPISDEEFAALNEVDLSLVFGWFMTIYAKKERFLTVGILFDYLGEDDSD